MKIDINKPQLDFILKAIYGLNILYDFDNTSKKEFKATYGYAKEELIQEVNNLKSEVLSK